MKTDLLVRFVDLLISAIPVSKRVPTMVKDDAPPAAKRKPAVAKVTKPIPKGQSTLGSFFTKKK